MALNLLSSDESDAEDISKIQIDEEFARRYEHNNKREDLHRLQELEKKGLVDDSSNSSSDSSSQDDEISNFHSLHSTKKDAQFFDALLRVRNRDPSLKLKETSLFEPVDDDFGKGTKRPSKKNKPVYLKDVNAMHLMEAGPNFLESDGTVKVRSYNEEQEELRNAFLDAVNDHGDDEEELFKPKEKRDHIGNDGSEDMELQNNLDDYFGRDGQLGEGDSYLRNFFSNKMWIEEEKGHKVENIGRISEDEDDVENQEAYEREYNFRYEEGMEDRVLGHSRSVHGVVRKKKSSRKVQRENKMDRMVQAEIERKEELKRLKSLKKQEIISMRDKIKKTAGANLGSNCPFGDFDFENDFDPENYDKKMGEMFDESYYNAEDADPDFDSGGDEYDGGLQKSATGMNDNMVDDGFLGVDKVMLNGGVGHGEVHDSVDKGKSKKKKKNTGLDDEEVEELYKLDYEDVIGDIKTRFRYTEVKSNRYGLKPAEILLMDDKELNQYVSLKKIATFTDEEWKVPNSKRFEQKKKNSSLYEEFLNSNKGVDGSKRLKNSSHKVLTLDMNGTNVENSISIDEKSENGQHQEDSCDMNAKTEESRKKRHRKKFKLSSERLIAYGKVVPKPKKHSEKQ